VKTELTYQLIADMIKKENNKIDRKEKIVERFGILIFGILGFTAGIGGFFIWFQFDLFGPKHLSFLGILWALFFGIVAIAFACQYNKNRTKKQRRSTFPTYDVAEDAIYDIRYINENPKELYCSFVELKRCYQYGYTKLPQKYKDAKPGDKYYIVIDRLTNDIIFMGTKDEYSTQSCLIVEEDYDVETKHVLYYETVENLRLSGDTPKGIKLDNSNSKREIRVN
jgi:hypothetical protein